MKYNLSPILIGASIAFIQPQSTTAQSSPQVAQVAKQITVSIDSENSNGSGVIIDKSENNYTVLTAAHVVGREDKYDIVTADNLK